MNNKLSPEEEKRLNRFLFPCIANILYVIPCFMGLLLVVFTTAPIGVSILASATMLAALPVSFFGFSCLKKHRGRQIAILLAAVVLVLHVVCAVYLGVRYILLAPSAVLLALYICHSKVIDSYNPL